MTLLRTVLPFALALPAINCGDNVEAPCDRDAVGVVCRIAGVGENGYSGEEGPALEARLSLPMDTLGAPDGTLIIIDWNNHRLRRLTTDGVIHFIAGNGEIGGSIDDPADGNFNHPTGILFDPTDPTGNTLYISAWHNSQIRVLDLATGAITDDCGDGKRAYFGDGGDALTSSLDLPASIAFDPDGNLVILDQANQVIRRVVDGTIERIAGQCVIDAAPPAGPGKCPDGTEPTACPAPSGKFVCGDPAEFCSKPCTPGYGGDEGPALSMRMAQSFGQAADPGGRIAYDKQGNLYFADGSNNLIRMIDTDGIVHRVAGQAPVDGAAQGGFAGDGGPALEATLNHPIDLQFDIDGTLYFTDVFNHCVRAIGPDQTVRTVAGVCGVKGNDGDGGLATDALFNRPYGISLVGHDLIIADTGNSVIRAVRLR